MIAKDKILTVLSSNSCFRRNISGNQSESGDSYLISVHQNEINLVKFRCDGDCQPETRILNTTDQEDNAYIIQIYIFNDIEDINLVCSFSLLEYNNLNDGVDVCAQGIAAFDSLILVGGTHGRIYVFDTFHKKDDTDDHCVVFKELIANHRNNIIDISADETHIVSCDVSNLIIVWYWSNDTLAIKVQFEPPVSDSCTCVSVINQYVVAAFTSGCLRVYNMHKQKLIAQVYGHAKCISCIDVCVVNKMIVTVAEDCFIRIFQFNESEEDSITHKWCSSIPNSILVGVTFFDDGKSFAVSSYDSKEIHIYKIN